MSSGALLTPPALIASELNLPAAWIAAVVAVVLGLLGQRRLPPGLSQGLFVAGLSVLLLGLLPWPVVTGAPVWPTAAGLAGISLLWLLAAGWIERGPARRAATSNELAVEPAAGTGDDVAAMPTVRDIRRGLALAAALAAGLSAAAVLVADIEGRRYTLAGVTATCGVLTGLALWTWLRRREPPRLHVLLGALGVLAWLVLPRPATDATRRALALAALAASVLVLLVQFVLLLREWRQRVHRYRSEPHELVAPPAPRRRTYAAMLTICALVGVAGFLAPHAALMPPALLGAAFAALNIGHARCSNGIGEFGLALVGGAIVSAACAWLPHGSAAALLGWALTGAYFAWLARFWRQQLSGGRPWTTAGRLIPAAQRLSVTAAGGAILTAASCALRSDAPAGWTAFFAALLLCGHASLLIRAARLQRSAAPAMAATGVLLAVAVPVTGLLSTWMARVPVAPVLAALALLLAVRVRRERPRGPEQWAWDAAVGAVVPLAVLGTLPLHGDARDSVPAAILALLLTVAAGVLHFSRGRGAAGP